MLWKRRVPSETSDLGALQAMRNAIERVNAVIFFDLDGNILEANDLFCQTMGYALNEIVGKHHRIFADAAYAASPEYAEFWRRLRSGEIVDGDFERLDKNGKTVHLSAFYTPVLDANGKPYQVVKFATDITPRREAQADFEECLTGMSEGDLRVRIPATADPVFDKIRQQFNITLDKLETMVRSINGVTEILVTESAEISGNASDLAQRGEAQAATLEETAAALEEISTAIQGTAMNAQEASKAAQTASGSAEEGTRVVSDAIDAMKEIKNGSSEIGKIIEVIDSISFQTNLLALNAGIEAARAGDAGRGFAVVASEIRALAQRTAEAAKDISDLIVNSNANVSTGAQLVDQTGDSLDKIREVIMNVVTNIDEISSATSEQADGIAAVTEATSQIDITTQQNAIVADESAQIASKLASSADELKKQMGAFRAGGGGRDTSSNTVPFRNTA